MFAQGMTESLSSPVLERASVAHTSERQIWEAALLLVREHGEDAADVAASEARKYRDDTDGLKYMVWSWITRATAELIKPEPELGEYLQ